MIELEELTKAIHDCGDALESNDFIYYNKDNVLDSHFGRIAIKLSKQGYRKEQDTLNDFIAWLKDKLLHEIEEGKEALKIIGGTDDLCDAYNNGTIECLKTIYNTLELYLKNFFEEKDNGH